VRLAFCILPSRALGLAEMTTNFPPGTEYDTARKDLESARAQAVQWHERMLKDPEKAVIEFNEFAKQAQRGTAFILASYRPLEEFLILFDARKQRETLGASAFLNYLQALPEESQQFIRGNLQKEQKPGMGPTTDSGTSVDRFIDSFFLAGTQKRYDSWKLLSEQEQLEAKGNRLIKDWADGIVPAVKYYDSMESYTAQPMGAVIALSWRTGLPDPEEMEAQEADSYQACKQRCMDLMGKATAAEKLELWTQLQDYPEAQTYLKLLVGGDPAKWQKEIQARSDYLPAVPSTASPYTAVRQDSDMGGQSAAKASAPVIPPDFWECLNLSNKQVLDKAGNGSVVQVLQVGDNCKFVARTPELAAAFPGGAWGKFTVTLSGLDDVDLTAADTGGVDLAKFRDSLRALSQEYFITVQLIDS
jgi:hypothetical protein